MEPQPFPRFLSVRLLKEVSCATAQAGSGGVMHESDKSRVVREVFSSIILSIFSTCTSLHSSLFSMWSVRRVGLMHALESAVENAVVLRLNESGNAMLEIARECGEVRELASCARQLSMLVLELWE